MISNKTQKIAVYEYKHHVLRKRFWIAVLSVPIGLVLVSLFSMFSSLSAINTDPIGYVDYAALIKKSQVLPTKKDVFNPRLKLIVFDDEKKAKLAVENEQIQGFFVIPKGYQSTFKVTYYSDKPLSNLAKGEIRSFLRENLLAEETILHSARLSEGSNFTLQSVDGSHTIGEDDYLNVIIPLIVGVLFFIVIISSGGYLLQALVEEKENRTMEIMVTSVSPNQLMTGKIIGNLSVGVTQLLAWIILAAFALLIFKNRIGFLEDLKISWSLIITNLLLLLPAFISTSALMATLGATVTDTQESQQVSGLVTFPLVLPYYFVTPIINNPSGIFARVLSYFPPTAPVTMSLRMAFSTVPNWEIALVFCILVSFAILTIWMAGKAFRAGMLQYSKRIRLTRIFSREYRHE